MPTLLLQLASKTAVLAESTLQPGQQTAALSWGRCAFTLLFV
jgi:hypothetical protein